MLSFVCSNQIRSHFSQAMSEMYRTEVPLYGTLIDLIKELNHAHLRQQPALKASLEASGELARLNTERHGAIRVGSATELFLIRRLFAVMGMYPVGYYDLSIAGLPVHSTAFRPIDHDALHSNPFRIFTSLLRLELLEDRALAAEAKTILSRREIVSPRALALVTQAEQAGGLNNADAEEFVHESLETFRWHANTTVTRETYQQLNNAHSLIADIVCFRGPHINHLTPRALDIDAVQRSMPTRGIPPKLTIEGPPPRQVDILLRQTSFTALEESIHFQNEKNDEQKLGTHRARFGEVEQRGAALTPKGRKLYDTILHGVRATAEQHSHEVSGNSYPGILQAQFSAFPDDWPALCREGLVYVRYYVSGEFKGRASTINTLMTAGALACSPQIYEDFLPVSAAGIFHSNLDSGVNSQYSHKANKTQFEQALGCPVYDEFSLYSDTEKNSLTDALRLLHQEHLIG